MNRKTKGRLAEVKAVAYFISHEFEVYMPFSDCSKYDLLVVKNGEIGRVSVKYTSTQSKTGTWIAGLRQISRRNHGATKIDKFDNTQFDYVAVYIGPEDRIVVVPATAILVKSELQVK